MKSVGITGCTSGLGKRLIELLIMQKYKIKALVRKTSKINNIKDKNKIKFVYGDVTDYDSLKEFVKDLDICFHIAAMVKDATKKQFFKVNVEGTDNLCKAVLEYNPECRFVHCSTISTLKVNPLMTFKSSVYGVSKYYGEKKVMENINNNGLKGTIIYPGLIYGPYDKTVVPATIYLLKNNRIKLGKGGEKNAPVIFVDELCDLFIKAGNNENAIGKKYISIKGAEIGIHDFVRMIAKKMKYKTPEKVYSKKILFLKALYFEFLYKIMGQEGKAPLNRTLVNIFSINFKTYKKRYDDPKKDLDWEQSTSREFIDKTLDISLEWMKKNTKY